MTAADGGAGARRSGSAAGDLRRVLEGLKAAFRDAPGERDALSVGRLFGTLAAMNDAGLYADDELVRLFCGRFGSGAEAAAPPDRDALHVVSDAYRHGGHTRLMERLAEAHAAPPDLVVTRSTQIDYRAKGEPFAATTDLSALDDVARLERLGREMARYRTIVLHITEDDFCAAVAAWRARQRGSLVFFVNHADHHFSFGREGASCILQVSAFGERLTAQHLPRARSAFVGIPLPGTCEAPAEPRWGSDTGVHLVTAGASWKYKPQLGQSLPRVVARLLAARPDAAFTAIGVHPVHDAWWWGLKLRYPRRVRLRQVLPHAEYLSALDAADVLIDSYPITGGTAFPEAVWRGRFACALRSPWGGASPSDALRVETWREILALVDEPRRYRERLLECQRSMEEAHGLAHVRARYLAALAAGSGGGAPYGDVDPTFLSRAWERRGRVRVPRVGAVRSRYARRAFARVLLPVAPRLGLSGLVRALRFGLTTRGAT